MKNDEPITGEELRKKIDKKIKEEPKLSLREISRHMATFKNNGIVECLDEGAVYSRHYILRKKGSVIKEKNKGIRAKGLILK